eukprot:gb/GEZJ01004950.1/.p1 GENE.gb/GEZJ01004950.1/~~gb/GEZJ01004950.1/.p1  ORF type:complete len:136 (+),score=20.47 gb/GEZJ01004950.1/:301-708(+)
MSGSEKWDKFVSGLKPKIQFEDRKANFIEFEEATKIAMRVEASFAGISLDSPSVTPSNSGPTPMEIDNTELRRNGRSRQRLLDIRNNARFTCHKPGCRRWKHRQNNTNTASVANIEAALDRKGATYESYFDSEEN